MQNSHRGQGLSEYGLIAGLVAVVGIAAMMALGGDLNSLLGGMKSEMAARRDQAKQVALTDPFSGGISSQPAQQQGGTGNVVITTKAGNTIVLNDYPRDLASSVQTAGTNGTTALLAANIESLARQLLDSGEISESQYNQFAQLAKQGEKLAEMEKLYEDASLYAASVPGKKIGSNGQIQYDGESYYYGNGEFPELAGYSQVYGSIPASGQRPPYDPAQHPNPMTEKAVGELQVFNDIYKKLLTDGALKDPSVKAAITGMSSQIVYMHNIIMDVADTVGDETVPPGQLKDKVAKAAAHGNAAGVCSQGSGIECAG